jgi:hypothetical protein
MVRELMTMPFRIAGALAEGALALVRNGDEGSDHLPDRVPPSDPPADAQREQPESEEIEREEPKTEPVAEGPTRRDPEASDWDADAPVPPGGSDPDDLVIQDRVSSEVLGRSSVPTGEINLNVENGVVFLRGKLDDDAQIEELISATGEVEGVVRVENLLNAA